MRAHRLPAGAVTIAGGQFTHEGDMNPKSYYEHQVATLPAGAERAVYRVLSYHVGLEQAIQKPDLQVACMALGTKFSDERQLRLTIVKLRKAGVPVCSSSGDSGYFLAGSMEEYREFRNREYAKKITDMRETMGAMDKSVREMFADEYETFRRERAERAGQPALI
jgi:hypothetical protein